ncbi:MAG: GAF domain-containing sensor histidine kinase [Chloroflexi bacterium]|nr:GAF domain-containing sensor histidine kinase [Chloroflexota bacterium]
MAAREDYPQEGWGVNLRLLRCASVVLPIAFLVLLDVLRHTLLARQFEALPGVLAFYAVVAVAVIMFSLTIFRLLERLQQRILAQNQQLAALNGIAAASTANLPFLDLLQASLGHILPTIRADAGLICLIDAEAEEHSVACYSGFSQEMARRLQRAKLRDDRVAYEVYQTGRPVINEDVFKDPGVHERARQEGIAAFISAPLKSEGEVNGILAIANHNKRRYSLDDRTFLGNVGGQLGMAIRKAVLYEQSQSQNRELSALLSVGKVVTSSFDLDELLDTSLDTVLQVASADAAEVWLMEGGQTLTLCCHRGLHREAFMERTSFAVGEGVPGKVAQSGALFLTHDLPAHPDFLRQEVLRAGFHTFCALPLLYRGRLVGVLAVAAVSPDVLKNSGETRILEGVGEWLAIAIENSRLYQQVQDTAVLQERERLAREMHDGMAQLLGYINTQTIAVNKLLADNRLADAREELTRMGDITRDLYADVREGILGLRTATLRQEGLLFAIQEYIQRYMELAGIKVSVVNDSQFPPLLPSTEIQLMRILQEALTNVRKHARASEVVVTMHLNQTALNIAIADNGTGFDLERLPSKGWPRFGLQTMRERAEAVGGALAITSYPGQGTTVTVSVPVSGQRG